MINKDSVFDDMNYRFIWSKNILMNCFGQTEEIALMVDGEEDGIFEDEQYEAYQCLIENWEGLQHTFLEAILEYYIRTRHELGYDVEENDYYPLVATKEQLSHMITLTGITVPYAGLYGGRSIGVGFDCSWNIENGVGIRLSDEKIIGVGYQDITA